MQIAAKSLDNCTPVKPHGLAGTHNGDLAIPRHPPDGRKGDSKETCKFQGGEQSCGRTVSWAVGLHTRENKIGRLPASI